MSFKSKVIAITGAASGMGQATSQLLSSLGATLSLADINLSALEAVAEQLPTPSSSSGEATAPLCVAVDVRDPEAVNGWIRQTLERFGRLDGAVNMAGIIRPAKPIAEMEDGDWDETMGVNAKGVFNCLRAEIKGMEKGGSIVSFFMAALADFLIRTVSAASVFGQFGAPGNSAYCASKAAVIALTRTAAKENMSIRVNCVSPGSVDTPMSRGEDPEHVQRGLQVTALKRRAQPIEVAKVIAFLLSDDASFVTGAVYNVDGGWVC